MGFALVAGRGVVEVLFAVGFGALVLMGGVFLVGGRFRRPPKSLSPVEFARARREAEGMESEVASRLMALAGVESVRSEVVEGGVWEEFAAASAGVEDDPLSAIEDLRSLAGVLDGLLAEFGFEESEIGCLERRRHDGSA